MAYQLDLSGRVALITGASGGLGAQFARTLSQAGAAVVLASRRVERLKELRAHIEADGGDAHVVALDVTETESIRAAVAHAAPPDPVLVTTADQQAYADWLAATSRLLARFQSHPTERQEFLRMLKVLVATNNDASRAPRLVD